MNSLYRVVRVERLPCLAEDAKHLVHELTMAESDLLLQHGRAPLTFVPAELDLGIYNGSRAD